ncbi:MAG: T9SS type A sorting domain-containing protein, partial [Hymenobacteraceae bacterium]|nr:T9SS type A sorting domain-containing protein [Hymenobacteraceae bacterium]
ITSNDEDFYLVKLSGLGLPYKPDYCSTLPVAGFTASLLAGDTVAFADLSAAGTRYGTISKWEWHLGDGSVSSDSVPKHKYSQPISQLYNTPVTLVVTNNSGCRASVTLYPFRTLSTASALPEVQVSLYPNPVKEQALIRISGYSKTVTLQLLDVTGRKLQLPVAQKQQGEVQELELNTASLPKGLYLYRLSSEGKVVATGKLVKD